ncbi:hypothetical protein HKX48_004661 [Thoreauomyces humboldtii]|nr:hypothetical protein HKX48_004661 [Thoreauomyces humboldtii]
MSGFGNSDRRPVDPPPILQLITYGSRGPIPISLDDAATFVVHASLWSADGNEDRNVVVSPYYYVSRQDQTREDGDDDDEDADAEADDDTDEMEDDARPREDYDSRRESNGSPAPMDIGGVAEASEPTADPDGMIINPAPLWGERAPVPTRRLSQTSATGDSGSGPSSSSLSPQPKEQRDMIQTLVGSVVSQCMALQDLEGRDGFFAVFHDLSIRTPGQYRIRFSLLRLFPNGTPNGSMTTPIVTTALSDVVSVFQPKRFPGLLSTTRLSEHFAHQGLPIHVRKFVKSKRLPANIADL